MHEIRIPRLGWSMEEGTFVRWLRKQGETVAKGQALFELEGDKSVQEIESVEGGVLHIPEGSPRAGARVDVGTLLGYLLSAGEVAPEEGAKIQVEVAEQGIAKEVKAGPAARRLSSELGVDLVQVKGTGRAGLITKEDVSNAVEMRGLNEPKPEMASQVVASPRARRVAKELGIDWRECRGSGRGGRVREVDVVTASKKLPKKIAAVGQRLSGRRKAIAERLRRSQEQTVPVTLQSMADVTELVALRGRLKESDPGSAPSYTDIILCLLPRVFKANKQMSVVWDRDCEGLVAVEPERLSVGIAVDTPEGLLVPVIRDLAQSTLKEITEQTQSKIELARRGELPGEMMRGGCFTVTNLGAYGVDGFTPVINLPEIAILGLGAIRREPVFVAGEKVEARWRMTLSLTFDHAAVDGAPAAKFLKTIVEAVGDPAAFLLNCQV